MSIVVADLHLSVLSASHRGQYSVVVMCTCCAIRTPDNNSGNQSQLTAPGDYVADRNITTLPIALPATNDGYNCFTLAAETCPLGNAIQSICLKFNGISNSIPPPTILPSSWFADFWLAMTDFWLRRPPTIGDNFRPINIQHKAGEITFNWLLLLRVLSEEERPLHRKLICGHLKIDFLFINYFIVDHTRTGS